MLRCNCLKNDRWIVAVAFVLTLSTLQDCSSRSSAYTQVIQASIAILLLHSLPSGSGCLPCWVPSSTLVQKHLSLLWWTFKRPPRLCLHQCGRSCQLHWSNTHMPRLEQPQHTSSEGLDLSLHMHISSKLELVIILLNGLCNGQKKICVHLKAPTKVLLRIGWIWMKVVSHDLGMALRSTMVEFYAAKLRSSPRPPNIIIENHAKNGFKVFVVFFLFGWWRVLKDHLSQPLHLQFKRLGSKRNGRF